MSEEMEVQIDLKGTYKTKQVADYLKETPQTIRNLCNEFEPYMSDIGRTPENGHRHFTYKNIQELQEIIKLTKSGLTYAQVKERLKTPEGIMETMPVLADETDFCERLAKILKPSIEDMVKQVINEATNNNLENQTKLLLELNNSIQEEKRDYMVQIDQLRDLVVELRHDNQQLVEMLMESNKKKGLFKFLNRSK